MGTDDEKFRREKDRILSDEESTSAQSDLSDDEGYESDSSLEEIRRRMSESTKPEDDSKSEPYGKHP